MNELDAVIELLIEEWSNIHSEFVVESIKSGSYVYWMNEVYYGYWWWNVFPVCDLITKEYSSI